MWSQDSPGVQGVSEDDDYFGSSLAVGDFEGDRFLDLAIGARGEMSGPRLKESGSLTVLYGGGRGLTGRDQIVTQDTRAILDASEANDRAAGALAAGDFDGDGVDDLAMGVSAEGVDGRVDAGAVNVIYGTRGVGLTGAGDRFVHQGLPSIPGVPRHNELFGAALAVGDFNGDDRDDLAIGAPDEIVAEDPLAGTVTTVFGSSTGLALLTSRTTSLRFFPGGYGHYARFGAALAAGDVDGDGYDELAIGSPMFEDQTGRVDVVPGHPANAPAEKAVQVLTSGSFDLPGFIPGSQERFGAALLSGDFDTTIGADLVVGVSRADLRLDGKRHDSAGAAVQTFSRLGQLSTDAFEWIHQGSIGTGTPEDAEYLGYALPGSNYYVD